MLYGIWDRLGGISRGVLDRLEREYGVEKKDENRVSSEELKGLAKEYRGRVLDEGVLGKVDELGRTVLHYMAQSPRFRMDEVLREGYRGVLGKGDVDGDTVFHTYARRGYRIPGGWEEFMDVANNDGETPQGILGEKRRGEAGNERWKDINMIKNHDGQTVQDILDKRNVRVRCAFSDLLRSYAGLQTKPIVIVDTKSFEGKSDPTQYDAENHIILVKPTYNVKLDPEGWMVHEYEHGKLSVKDDGKPYPENAVERVAYTVQFKFLKSTKKAERFEDLKNSKKFPTLSLKITKHGGEYEPILKKYWEMANGKDTPPQQNKEVA